MKRTETTIAVITFGLTETTIVLITSWLVLLLFASAPGLVGEGGLQAEDREENSTRASEMRETARVTGIVLAEDPETDFNKARPQGSFTHRASCRCRPIEVISKRPLGLNIRVGSWCPILEILDVCLKVGHLAPP